MRSRSKFNFSILAIDNASNGRPAINAYKIPLNMIPSKNLEQHNSIAPHTFNVTTTDQSFDISLWLCG